VVIIDLKERESVEYIASEHTRTSSKGREQLYLLSSYPERIFDPRPFVSILLSGELESFFKRETIILVFCSTNEIIEYHPVKITNGGNHQEYPETYSLYSFIPGFPKIHNKAGDNILLSTKKNCITSLLQKYISDFTYQVVFDHPKVYNNASRQWIERDAFFPLLFNSDQETVGFIDLSMGLSKIVALPQINGCKKNFVLELVENTLPEVFPTIFPYSEQFSWLKSEAYLLPNQSDFLKEKIQLKTTYEIAIAETEIKINNNQAEYQFLHDLITETDNLLVKSIELFFKWLEFENIVNMDETNPTIREEDLQITLDNGLLIVEAKGIGGTSKDNDCSQINKIKYRRAKERGSFDVSALYVVNHQRYLPPHERKNPPFSENQISDAHSEERGLLTTYELFKLYSNIESGFITKNNDRKCLLNFGLIEFHPSNSLLIGYPLEVHHKGEVVIIDINDMTLFKGGFIIACNNSDWVKVEILEIKLDGKTVESASEGQLGIKLSHSVLKISKLWLENT
jgi:hypothetical protein